MSTRRERMRLVIGQLRRLRRGERLNPIIISDDDDENMVATVTARLVELPALKCFTDGLFLVLYA